MSRADCTVKALSAVAGIGYELAEAIASDGGRSPGRRAKSARIIDAARDRGLAFRKIRFTGTVRRFIKTHPLGAFYATKRGHAFGIINGKIMDGTAPGSAIVNVWEYYRSSAG